MSRPLALVVDDDTLIRRMLARVLGVFGFQVPAAADGPEALALADAHVGPIRLLLTNIEMPERWRWHLRGLVRCRHAPLAPRAHMCR